MVKTNWFTAFPVSMNISYGVKYASLNKFEASIGHIDKNSIQRTRTQCEHFFGVVCV